MKSIEELIRIKFNLECIGIRDENFLYRTEGITCDDIESFCVLYTDMGTLLYHSCVFPYVVDEVRRELWYYLDFDGLVNSPDVVPLHKTEESFETFVIYNDIGEIVSKCWSIRLNSESSEVAVETIDNYRGRGYGKQVVSKWAEYQLSLGKVPIYAHRLGNTASEALAKSLKAIKFAEVTSYHSWRTEV